MGRLSIGLRALGAPAERKREALVAELRRPDADAGVIAGRYRRQSGDEPIEQLVGVVRFQRHFGANRGDHRQTQAGGQVGGLARAPHLARVSTLEFRHPLGPDDVRRLAGSKHLGNLTGLILRYGVIMAGQSL